MILPPISDREFSVAEFGEGFDLVFGMCVSFLLIVGLIIVRGSAVLIRNAHVNESGVFAGPCPVGCDPPRPTFTIAGSGSVLILQGLILDRWI